jgi:hypothetical protein
MQLFAPYIAAISSLLNKRIGLFLDLNRFLSFAQREKFKLLSIFRSRCLHPRAIADETGLHHFRVSGDEAKKEI